MYMYSDRSRTNLKECHPDLVLIFETVSIFYNNSIIEGIRSKEEQNIAYHQGRSKLKWPRSKHNVLKDGDLSSAVDALPYPINWKNKKRFYHFAGVVKGVAETLLEDGKITHKIRWGGDWDSDNDLDDQSFMDLVHFELKKI